MGAGCAVDFGYPLNIKSSAEHKWMRAHAGEHGWWWAGGQEWWSQEELRPWERTTKQFSFANFPDAGVTYYEVKPGDILTAIAAVFRVAVSDIKANNELPSDVIYPGQKMRITLKYAEPWSRGAPGEYEFSVWPNATCHVKARDTPTRVAEAHNWSPEQLKKLNRMPLEGAVHWAVGRGVRAGIPHIPWRWDGLLSWVQGRGIPLLGLVVRVAALLVSRRPNRFRKSSKIDMVQPPVSPAANTRRHPIHPPQELRVKNLTNDRAVEVKLYQCVSKYGERMYSNVGDFDAGAVKQFSYDVLMIDRDRPTFDPALMSITWKRERRRRARPFRWMNREGLMPFMERLAGAWYYSRYGA